MSRVDINLGSFGVSLSCDSYSAARPPLRSGKDRQIMGFFLLLSLPYRRFSGLMGLIRWFLRALEASHKAVGRCSIGVGVTKRLSEARHS